MSERAEPVGGRILTTPMKFLLGLAGLGAVLTIWRFAVGLGPSTGMSDAYPWGIWIAWDVVTGTALGCGGYPGPADERRKSMTKIRKSDGEWRRSLTPEQYKITRKGVLRNMISFVKKLLLDQQQF